MLSKNFSDMSLKQTFCKWLKGDSANHTMNGRWLTLWLRPSDLNNEPKIKFKDLASKLKETLLNQAFK